MPERIQGDNCSSPPDARIKDLSPESQCVVELIRHVHFGRLEGLIVRGGEPVFAPPPRIVRTYKFGAHACNEPRPQAGDADFSLKREILDLLDLLRRIGDGRIGRIDIAHGLPLAVEIEDDEVALIAGRDSR